MLRKLYPGLQSNLPCLALLKTQLPAPHPQHSSPSTTSTSSPSHFSSTSDDHLSPLLRGTRSNNDSTWESLREWFRILTFFQFSNLYRKSISIGNKVVLLSHTFSVFRPVSLSRVLVSGLKSAFLLHTESTLSSPRYQQHPEIVTSFPN